MALILEKAQTLIKLHGGVNDESRREFSRWLKVQAEFSGGERAYNLLNDDGRVYQSVGMGAPEYRHDKKFHVPLIHPVTKKPCPVPPNGWSRSPSTLQGLLEKEEIIFGVNDQTQPRRKVFLTEESKRQLSSVIQDAKSGKAFLDALGLEFPYSHPVSLYDELLGAIEYYPGVTYLDYFAGSGTAGHSVINLNRTDNGRRKFILIEAGAQFIDVLVPRISKVVYSSDWRAGKPQIRSDRYSSITKLIRLESYEDAINNLESKRPAQAQLALDSKQTQGIDGFKEQYILKYMLDVETNGSQSLLNIKDFRDPTAYKMLVKRPGTDESKLVNVDLIETFNWLLGLTVDHIAAPQTFTTTFKRDEEKRLVLDKQLKQAEGGNWWFRIVTGKDSEGRSVLVIWRKRPGGDEPEGIEQDNLVLNEWFRKLGFSTKDREFDLIYVNGSNNLENVRTADEKWKVRLIEEDFMHLMFDVEDI